MANTQLKFFRVATLPTTGVVGGIYFETTHNTINVYTNNGWEKYAGKLESAEWDDAKKVLTLKKYDGSSVQLDFSDMASATAIAAKLGSFSDAAANDENASIHARINKAFEDINTKLNSADQVVKSVDTTADAGVALVKDAAGKLSVSVAEGAVAKDNNAVVLGGQVYTAVEAAKTELANQIAGKNVSAEGDAYVSATAAGNKVTVAATDKLTAAVAATEGLKDAAYATVESINATAKGYADAAQAAAEKKAGELATAAENAAKKYTDDYNTNTVQPKFEDLDEAIAALGKEIDDVAGAAKTYSIVPVTENLDANVKEAFKLVDEAGVQSGAQINIYKDSALQKVELVNQELQFTYLLANGTEETVGVDVSSFLAESEFKDGLQVVDHIVKVKIADGSEAFLSVDANGLKLSGVQAAINTAEGNAKTYADGLKSALEGTLAADDAKTLEAINDEINAIQETINGLDIAGDIEDALNPVKEDVKALEDWRAGLNVSDEGTGYVKSVTQVDGKIVVVKEALPDFQGMINALDAEVKDEAGYVKGSITQVDGVITAASFDVTPGAIGEDALVTGSTVKTYVDNQITEGLSWAMFE